MLLFRKNCKIILYLPPNTISARKTKDYSIAQVPTAQLWMPKPSLGQIISKLDINWKSVVWDAKIRNSLICFKTRQQSGSCDCKNRGDLGLY